MRADDKIRITHMLEACEKISGHTKGRHRGDLDNDETLQLARVRAIELVG